MRDVQAAKRSFHDINPPAVVPQDFPQSGRVAKIRSSRNKTMCVAARKSLLTACTMAWPPASSALFKIRWPTTHRSYPRTLFKLHRRKTNVVTLKGQPGRRPGCPPSIGIGHAIWPFRSEIHFPVKLLPSGLIRYT